MSRATGVLDRPVAPDGIVPYPGPGPRQPVDRPGPRASARRPADALPLIAGLAAIAALVPAHELWPVQLAQLALLLTVPGLALLRALGVPRTAIAATPVYVPGASLAVLLAAGIAVDAAGPAMGVAAPLRTTPLLVGIEACCLLLVGLAALRRPQRPGRPIPTPWPRLVALWPLLLPLASAAGAARLTNGDGGAVAVATLAVAVAVLAVTTVAAGRLDTTRLALVLFGVGLALAWSFSLRGGSVYGFDISGELPIVESTRQAGVWHASHPSDAYGAMLSLTILPALLTALTGISSLVLLKAVYPALFALLPVTVLLIARRHLPAQYAFAAAAFIVVQANFAQQLPAIARQEIGLVAFAILLAATLDRRMPRRAQWPLVACLGLALVLSHYSTTYLTIAILAVGVVLQLAVSLARPVPRASGALVVALMVTAVGAACWYGPVTHSGSNVTRLTDALRDDGLRILPNRAEGGSVLDDYLKGNLQARTGAARYQRLAQADYARNRPYVHPLPAAASPAYDLREAPALPAARNATAAHAIDRLTLTVLQFANIVAIAGALGLVLARRTRPGLRVIALLGLAALGSLAFIRLSGTIAANYNQDRAFLQALVPLSIGLAWAAWAVSRRMGRARPVVIAAVALALGGIGLSGSGLVGWALGRPTTNVADHGDDYERFYATGPDIAAAQWLRGARPARGLLYTDRYGQLRTIAERVPAQGLLLDVTPRTLDRSAWVYATSVNVLDGRARGSVGDQYATFAFPRRFLADNWDTVYANGASEVYRR